MIFTNSEGPKYISVIALLAISACGGGSRQSNTQPEKAVTMKEALASLEASGSCRSCKRHGDADGPGSQSGSARCRARVPTRRRVLRL